MGASNYQQKGAFSMTSNYPGATTAGGATYITEVPVGFDGPTREQLLMQMS
jgi:hypothetical protein